MELWNRLRQTHCILLSPYFDVFDLLLAAYFLSRLSFDRSIEVYKMKFVEDQTQKIAFTLRTHLEPGKLSIEQMDWLKTAVNVYSMSVRYYAPDHEEVLYDSGLESQQYGRPFTASSPIYVDGQLIGILDATVDLDHDFNLPSVSFFRLLYLEVAVVLPLSYYV